MENVLFEVKCMACGKTQTITASTARELFMFSRCSRCHNVQSFKPLTIIEREGTICIDTNVTTADIG